MAGCAPHLSTMARAMSVMPLASLHALSALPVVGSFAVSTLIRGITGSLFAGSCGLQVVHLLGFISSLALRDAVVKLSQLLLSPTGFPSHTVRSSV